MQQTKQMMIHEQGKGYVLSGKTGWGTCQGKDIGWFIGYMETNENVYFFATNVEPQGGVTPVDFSQARILITKEVLGELMKK